MKDFTLCAVILVLALALYDTAGVARSYARSLASCANGVGFVIGSTAVMCTPVETTQPKKKAAVWKI